ncbi:MAG: purine-binding chemotaxis protein CheW [Spartobacteria bacterium]|nr:purine-binding chemotaxis protein CheW [Spartobacteria bacterium]
MNNSSTAAISSEQILIATFQLGDAYFGFDTAQVQEVLRLTDITPVNHAPEYVLGVMNMRGRISTVIDLGVKLELDPVSFGPECRIFMVEWNEEHVGLVVDRMADVLAVSKDVLKHVPENVHGVQSRQVRGVCHAGHQLVALLDLAEVLRSDARDGLAGAAS